MILSFNWLNLLANKSLSCEQIALSNRLRTSLYPSPVQLQIFLHSRNCFLERIRRLMVPSSHGQYYDFAKGIELNLVKVF